MEETPAFLGGPFSEERLCAEAVSTSLGNGACPVPGQRFSVGSCLQRVRRSAWQTTVRKTDGIERAVAIGNTGKEWRTIGEGGWAAVCAINVLSSGRRAWARQWNTGSEESGRTLAACMEDGTIAAGCLYVSVTAAKAPLSGVVCVMGLRDGVFWFLSMAIGWGARGFQGVMWNVSCDIARSEPTDDRRRFPSCLWFFAKSASRLVMTDWPACVCSRRHLLRSVFFVVWRHWLFANTGRRFGQRWFRQQTTWLQCALRVNTWLHGG